MVKGYLFCISLFVIIVSITLGEVDNEAPVTGDEKQSFDDVGKEQIKEEEILYVTPKDPKNSYMAETFDNVVAFEKNWIKSKAKKKDVDEDISKYDGIWGIEPAEKDPLTGDRGLVLGSKGKHAAISSNFARPFIFKDKPLVVQYEVNFQNGQDCGGAYIKLLSKHKRGEFLEEFNDKTPYTIMFGPDKCGNDFKLHFIFRHVNPLNKTIEEKHSKRPKEKIEDPFKDKKPHLYTLILKPDNSYQINLDHRIVNTGSLLEDFTPSVNPPKEVADPNDSRPDDWDENEKIVDPSAVKPDDWDEDAPMEIKDETASMPDGWLEDEPEMIPDPEAEKQDDWDNEMDGEWEAPQISNPACESAPGCGFWTAPTIDNPQYKGKWLPPMINNPNYKGKWTPRIIRNPDYFEDLEPFKMTPIDAVGIELWSMSDGIYFDNILVTESLVEADEFAAETFDVKIAKLERGQKSFFRQVIDFSNQNPWIYAVYVIAVAIPVVLIFVCCCADDTKLIDAEKKKTDEPTADSPIEEENEGEREQSAGEEGVISSGEEEASEGDEKIEEKETSEGEELVEKTTPRTSPRLRKVRKE